MPWSVVAAVGAAAVSSAMAPDAPSGGGGSGSNAQQERLAGVQADMAQDQYARYKSIYEPLEQQYINESQGVGSIANQNKQAEQAAADVASGFAGARENLNETPGLNPNSDAYLRAASRLNLAEAATSASSQNTARQQVQDRGRAAMTDTISLGKGMPATASTMLASAGSGFGSAAAFAQRQNMFDTQQNNAGAAGVGRAVGGMVGSKNFQNWVNGSGSSSGPQDTYTQWDNSPMNEQIYSNGSLGD